MFMLTLLNAQKARQAIIRGILVYLNAVLLAELLQILYRDYCYFSGLYFSGNVPLH